MTFCLPLQNVLEYILEQRYDLLWDYEGEMLNIHFRFSKMEAFPR